MPELPVAATERQKLVGGLLTAAACGLLYLVPSQLTVDRAAVFPLAAWERSIPFVAESVWFYLAQYPLLVAAYLGCGSLALCTRFLYAVLFVQAAAALVFLCVPLRYPREWASVPPDTDALTRALAGWVHAVDAPVNCLPSLHVTSCLLSLMLVGRERRLRAAGYGLVAVASMASTLTFKQHYAIDLVAGAALAALGWWASGRWLARRRSTMLAA
jgi:hypothetical protein